MGTLTTFGELILTAFLTFVMGGIGFVVRSQLGVNKILSEGIQLAMSEIKLIRAMAEQKEDARGISCAYHSDQIVELKKKTERMDEDIAEIDTTLSKHLIEHNYNKK